MARFSIRYYKNSVIASLFSIAGSLMFPLGFLFLGMGILSVAEEGFGMILAGAVTAAIFCAIGGGLIAIGSFISSWKAFHHWWRTQIVKAGREKHIIHDASFAFQVYKAYPHKRTLKKIEKLNPEAAKRICQAISAKK